MRHISSVPTPSPKFPASNCEQRDTCLMVVSTAIGKLRRRELGRGRNRAPNYKVTRENQSHLELSWYWRHRAHQTVDQWVSLQGEGRRRGSLQDMLPQRKCATPCLNYPKVVRDPVTCSDVLVWLFTCLFWQCAHATLTKDLALGLVLQITMT